MQTMKVVCQQESKVIATMSLPGPNRKVDANWVWREYRPVSNEYVLQQRRSKDGEYLLCPHCFGKVELVSDNVEQVLTERADKVLPKVPSTSRTVARGKVLSDLSGAYHEHVKSDDRVEVQGSPFVLGSLRVKK